MYAGMYAPAAVAADSTKATPAEASGEDRAVASEQVRRRYSTTREIRLALLDVDEVQVRERMKNVAKLAQSMKRGQLHPIIVTLTPDRERFHLEAGARRVAAARMNGWTTIYAAITDEMSRLERLLLRVEENTQRDQLSGEERRRACLQIRDELGTGTKGAAELLGIDARTFRRVIREPEEGEVKAASRLSIGQISRALDRLREGAARVPAERRMEVLEKARGVVKALEAVENQEAEAARLLENDPHPGQGGPDPL
jgi:ParB/RepB/Spo0J family partition protein